MSKTMIFLLSCVLFQFFGLAVGICNVSKYNDGYKVSVKCSNATLSDATVSGGVTASITISQSRIPTIPNKAFSSSRYLQILNLHNCEIRQIEPEAFYGIESLEKLNLANNKLTVVRSSWFSNLQRLKQLDLSFNGIRSIEQGAFSNLGYLSRLNLDNNELTCVEPQFMEPMRSIAKIRVIENPLNLSCRAKMTLWFNDKGINYLNVDNHSGSEDWLDRVLWRCAEDDYVGTTTETQMRECVLLNLFNQLKLALKTTDSYKSSAQQCAIERQVFTSCIASSGKEIDSITNGEAMSNILRAFRSAVAKLSIS